MRTKLGSKFRKMAANKITLTLGQASQLALNTATEQPTTRQKTVAARVESPSEKYQNKGSH